MISQKSKYCSKFDSFQQYPFVNKQLFLMHKFYVVSRFLRCLPFCFHHIICSNATYFYVLKPFIDHRILLSDTKNCGYKLKFILEMSMTQIIVRLSCYITIVIVYNLKPYYTFQCLLHIKIRYCLEIHLLLRWVVKFIHPWISVTHDQKKSIQIDFISIFVFIGFMMKTFLAQMCMQMELERVVSN